MRDKEKEHQLGDFIKGRTLFIQEICKKKGLNFEDTQEAIRREAVRLAKRNERGEQLEKRLFGGAILASSYLPDWVDKFFLKAMTVVLQGPGSQLYTTSSKRPCIAFEAGRFNAHRQAEGVFHVFFVGKKPEEWLTGAFATIYRQCYGAKAAERLVSEQLSEKHFKIMLDNKDLEKAGPIDCSTVIGYLYGGLEKLGAKGIEVNHTKCAVLAGSIETHCIYDVTWK